MVTENQTKLNPLATVQANLVDQLRTQIRSVETAGRIVAGSRVSSGCSAIDRLLPESGYQRGTLVQWLTGGGHGADYLSLLVAREACSDGGALVVFDPLHQFYPPAVAAIGINLDNLIVLRTYSRSWKSSTAGFQNEVQKELQSELQNDLLWSIDQALRCPAVAAVWGPLDHINERWFRRFQLSAESSGCLGLFVQPMRAARQPSWAEVQWVVSHGSTRSAGSDVSAESLNHRQRVATSLPSAHEASGSFNQQPVRLQLARCRGTQTGKTVNLSINTITGNVQLARRDYEQHQRTRIENQATSLQQQPRHNAG